MRIVGPKDLPTLAREPELPFELVLEDGSFVVTEVLRHLPGRRLTVGTHDSVRGAGVLKLFFGPHHERDCGRALRGQEGFTKASVETTPIIAQSRTNQAKTQLAWMLFARFQGASHADERDAIELADILGRLHFHGFSHTDLHLGNFLKTPAGALISIDSDAIEPEVLSVREGLAELAVLLAQFEIPTQPDLGDCLDAYLAAREESSGLVAQSTLRRLLAKAIRSRSAHYLQKALRECTNFMVREEAGRRWFCRREVSAVFAKFMEDPERFFGEGANVLKRGNSATVVSVDLPGQKLVAKRYNITSVGHRFRRIFRRRAREAWQNGLRLAFLGIPTAVPLGLIETGSRWWPGPAYVLMERLEGKDLATLTRSGYIDSFTLKDLVAIIDALQRSGLTHGDLKSTNFILSRGKLYLIDVDSIRVSRFGQKRDVLRLLANWTPEAPARSTIREALQAAGLKGA